ncbi:MAG: UDP-glucose 4-epimerase GalE [Bacteroidota bacterium]
MPKILITGGTGYIGALTAVEILAKGEHELISLDNFHNSGPDSLERVEKITGQQIKNYQVDAADKGALEKVFEENPDIDSIIHFAAMKAVGESVELPLVYYRNNLVSLMNILECCRDYGVKNFIFSSSCTVYGEVTSLPVTEDTPTQRPSSPYGTTKLVGEWMIEDFINTDPGFKAIALRYFNPVGAHETGLLGENPNNPNNLVPYITQVAAGQRPVLTVFGDDYETRDGSAVRDYIHVTDIALAHIMAVNYLNGDRNTDNFEIFNLGSGEGVSVLEAIQAFEQEANVPLNYQIGPRRPGDVSAIYSNPVKAADRLGWKAEKNINHMMGSAWKWQLNYLEDQKVPG